MTEFMPPMPDVEEDPSPEDEFNAKFDKQARKDFEAAARNHWHNVWRKESAQDFDFVAGGSYDDSGQWMADDIARLKEQNRPIITMNRLEPLVEGIVGAEVNNRQEVSYEARENDDKGVAETLGEVGKWARDNDVEEEETDQFRCALISGMGWTIHSMEYGDDLDGKYTVVSSDPLGHYWDVDSRRPNLSDARWVGYVEIMSKDKFKVLFPDQKGANNVFGIKGHVSGKTDEAAKSNTDYDDPNLMDVDPDDTPSEVHVLEFQCYQMEPAYRILDPATGELSPATDKAEFDKMRAAVEAQGAVMARFGTPVDPAEPGMPEPVVFRFLQQERRVYYRAFYSGNKRLEEVERNSWRNGFTMQCVTGRRHRRRNTWYGLVRAMKDPQRLLNSFMSAMIHNYNSNPKGGVFYEDGAVEAVEADLEAKLAHPAPAIKLNSGGLGMIQRIDPAPASPALAQMMQIVSDMPPMVTGVSMEWLGIAGRDQPVGLEQTRKLATLTIVAPIFSSYRKYKKNAGRLLFDFVKDYIPETTLNRVVRQANQQYVPLLKKADTLKYDIHVDDAPLSPSIKATVFSAMKDFAQFMFDKLPPAAGLAAAKAFFEYSPLPSDLVAELSKAMVPSPPSPMMLLQQLLELRKLAAEGRDKEASAELKETQAENEGMKPEMDQQQRQLEAFDSMINLLQVQIQSEAKQQTGNGATQ